MNSLDPLIRAARNAKERAVTPYSNFQVGAALLSSKGNVTQGCNIEVSSYGLTICAERVALFSALANGEKNFEKMVIVTDSEEYCPPCGACRQVLWDFAPELEIILVNNRGEQKTIALQELFPHPFGKDFLPEGDAGE